MADQAAKDAAAKQRIIAHMNADHHDSIIRYLQHYNGLASFRAYYGKLEDITLDRMSLSVGGKKIHHIDLKPPMTSYTDARARVVQMDKDASAALGKSDITVKDYVPPKGFHLVVLLVVIATLIGFSNRIWFQPGSIVARISPPIGRFFYAIQPVVITLVLVLHTTEMVYMIRGRLWKHSVNVCTALWWKWAIGTFGEGIGSFQRFDALVNNERVKKEKQRH